MAQNPPLDPPHFPRPPPQRGAPAGRPPPAAVGRGVGSARGCLFLTSPVGLDVILDLIPVAGSFVGAAAGAYMLWEARNLGMSKLAMARMAGNVGVDWALGLIPGIGIIPDFFFRSNTRNLRIIRRHLDKHHPATVTVEG